MEAKTSTSLSCFIKRVNGEIIHKTVWLKLSHGGIRGQKMVIILEETHRFGETHMQVEGSTVDACRKCVAVRVNC